ncbi:CRISPR-associated endonuclease Cas3'' [Anatilimnocola floriformis]|uniref:CRISPR-associated endonuclease Cas3'' n=1 Tax=Anatilimnocola floriformis TaxID=2948575 RepID=UPI0020C3E6EC|nr:CRISPR-associated endonuclease Cas3'' [Anatilimnocola floriformis]
MDLSPGRKFFAHTLPCRPPEEWESLHVHLREVAELAERFASNLNASEWGRLAGLWHDLGKFNPAFQAYLQYTNSSDDGHKEELKGRIDHSTFGAQFAVRQTPQLGRLLAYCIAGHHAGLPDNVRDDSGLEHRLKKVFDFDFADKDFASQLPAPELKGGGGRQHPGFTIAFFVRMIFSCLVDADFLCTERFMSPERSAFRPDCLPAPAELLMRLNDFLAKKEKTADPTPVNEIRRQVLTACRQKAAFAPGFFSLNVPTGGGKTLSSLAFALTHAAAHNLPRVIYAIPFTSIIEQTADIFRSALADESSDNSSTCAVLEHHSSIPIDDPERQSQQTRLAAENFEASLVVTTNVQLFESLFANRTSRCRKLHRLARSVIILDEAQTLPVNLLHPTLAALDELVRNYGSTVVLCTATQPAITAREDFPIGIEAAGVRPIIDAPQQLHDSLRRVQVQSAGRLDDSTLIAQLLARPKVLCIVNSKKHAAELYRLLSVHDEEAIHLSAQQCAAHRSEIIKQVRARVKDSRTLTCRVISTSVIEAGVDVDFPSVFRAAAGLDSIAQAAGRCNREGNLKNGGERCLGELVVFDYDEKLHRPPAFTAQATGSYRETLPDHRQDLLSPAAIEQFFSLHYWKKGGDQGEGWDRGKDKQRIMDCFGGREGRSLLHYQFRTAAEAYQIIDEAQTPVLVPYGQGKQLIEQLRRLPEPPFGGFDRAAQRYVVNVRERDLRTLLNNSVLLQNHDRYYLANDSCYHPSLGLVFEGVGLDPEILIG